MPENRLLDNEKRVNTQSLRKRTNCWEFLSCRDQSCPAYLRKKGRACYVVVGSYSSQSAAPPCLEGISTCRECSFFVAMESESQSFWATLGERARTISEGQSTMQGSATDENTKRILRERAQALSKQVETTEKIGERKVISFRLAQELFAIDLGSVTEVRKLEGYTPVPCTPPYIYGLVNLRGSFLTLMDIRSLLNISTQSDGVDLYYIVVIDTRGNYAGIVVDTIEDVMDLDRGIVRSPLATLQGPLQDYVESEIIIGNSQIAILNIKKLMASEHLMVMEKVDETE